MNKLTILVLAIMLIISISARRCAGGGGGPGGRGGSGGSTENSGEGSSQNGGRQGPPEAEGEDEKEPPILEEALADHPSALAYAQCFSTCLTTNSDLTSDEASHVSLHHLKYLIDNADAETTDNCGCASIIDSARDEAEAAAADNTSGDDTSADVISRSSP